jgi:hypothetical protein
LTPSSLLGEGEDLDIFSLTFEEVKALVEVLVNAHV